MEEEDRPVRDVATALDKLRITLKLTRRSGKNVAGSNMKNNLNKRKLILTSGRSMELDDTSDDPEFQPTSRQARILEQVCITITEYLRESKDLLNNQYASIIDWAPSHLKDSVKALVVCCEEGVVIRYDSQTEAEKSQVLCSWFNKSLEDIAPILSERFVHLYSEKEYESTVSTTGMEVTLFSESALTGKRTDHLTIKIGCDAVVESPQSIPEPPNKPFCLLSIQDSMEMQLFGELEREDMNDQARQRFLARSMIKLPVGWKCIEVFPHFNIEDWKPEYAAFWAKNDILSSIIFSQDKEFRFRNLDPRAGARQHYSVILKAYKELLDATPQREEILQRFLKENPQLLCPANTRVWPKLQLGDRITDFVFREAAGDYLLVELEKSTDRLFLKDGHTSRDLNHAKGQILDWKRYLEDNLSTVQKELGLSGISANPKGLIVIGRSSSLTAENRRKLTTLENESPKLKVITYDDAYNTAKTIIDNLLGPPWVTTPNTEIYYLPNS